jgi:MFS family permease
MKFDPAPPTDPPDVPPLSGATTQTAVTPLPPPATALSPLAHPVFRRLWLVWFAANTSMWMNDVTSAWLMTTLTTSPVLVALVSSASTLPVFLLGLPSGAIADIVNRRRWFLFTQLWVLVTASLLMVANLTGTLSSMTLLVLVFANGVGLALRWPVFAAIVPEIVPRHELGAALALNGLSMNMSRVIGPVVAGALIASLGSAFVFGLNALLAVAAAVVIARWRDEPKISALPGERFVGAMRLGVQYVRQSQRMKVVLARIFIFFFQSTALMALLPLVAKRFVANPATAGAGTFTLLLASMGAGAVAASLGMTSLRERLTRDQLINAGVLLHAACTAVVALAPNLWVAVPAMVLAGVAWISVANCLTLSAQLALPNWVRARGMSIYQMALMGGSALGAALWGMVASRSSVPTSLLAAAGFAVLVLLFMRRWAIEGADTPDLTPQRPWEEPTTAYAVDANEGPVMVTIEYLIDEQDATAFATVMEESRRSRLQLGALSWGLFRDIHDPRRFIEYYLDETWVEHRRRFDRLTTADVQLRERRVAFHRGEHPPKVERSIGQTLRGG